MRPVRDEEDSTHMIANSAERIHSGLLCIIHPSIAYSDMPLIGDWPVGLSMQVNPSKTELYGVRITCEAGRLHPPIYLSHQLTLPSGHGCDDFGVMLCASVIMMVRFRHIRRIEHIRRLTVGNRRKTNACTLHINRNLGPTVALCGFP